MTECFFYETGHEMGRAIAKILDSPLKEHMANKERGCLILPGGKSPQALLRELARIDLPWKNIMVGTTDERCVPLNSPESNAGQIMRIFAEEGVAISPLHMTRIDDVKKLKFPSIATILGMGLDGHIASLFPGQKWFSPENKKAVLSNSPAFPVERISLCYDTLLETGLLILLVSEPEKWDVCSRILDGKMPKTPLFRLLHEQNINLQLHVVRSGK